MKKKQDEFPILIVMLTYIIILLMYIYTYSQKSCLFWGFFVVERILSLSYEAEVDRYLAHLEVEHLKGIKAIVTIVFAMLSVGIFLYTPFKYPSLFAILIIGEIIDLIGKRIKSKIKSK